MDWPRNSRDDVHAFKPQQFFSVSWKIINGRNQSSARQIIYLILMSDYSWLTEARPVFVFGLPLRRVNHSGCSCSHASVNRITSAINPFVLVVRQPKPSATYNHVSLIHAQRNVAGPSWGTDQPIVSFTAGQKNRQSPQILDKGKRLKFPTH